MKYLVRSREYLSVNRRSIIGRSLAAALAGAIPVPLLDDWLVSSIRRATISKIAESRGVDIDEEAVRAIADGPQAPPKWGEMAFGGLALRAVSKQWKKLVVAALAAKRAKAAAHNFEIATLFDHYCARQHIGMGLEKASGESLRALIDRAQEQTRGGLSRQIFRRGLLAAAKSSAQAPMNIADALTGGRLGTLLSGEKEDVDKVEATVEVDEALESHIGTRDSFLARAAAAIELELAVDRNPYLGNLLDAFSALVSKAQRDEEK